MQLWTAFLLGLAGSLHCGAMCGPLLLALAKARPAHWNRAVGRIVYHLGRLAAYSALGLLFGLAGHALALGGLQRWLSLSLGFGLLAGGLVSQRLGLSAAVFRWTGWIRRAMGGLLAHHSVASQGALGALNGLLPCGLVYVATAGATATGSALSGAAFMTSFGLGTWPLLLGLQFLGQRLPLPPRLDLGKVRTVAVVLMALLLILRGLELDIPYLSPALTPVAEGTVSCH